MNVASFGVEAERLNVQVNVPLLSDAEEGVQERNAVGVVVVIVFVIVKLQLL